MADYISREAAIALTDQHCFETSYDAVWMEEALRNLQAADVRPVVRGKWVRGNENRTSPIKDSYICSVCGEKTLSGFCGNPAKTNFCPNCGADMRPYKDGRIGENDSG